MQIALQNFTGGEVSSTMSARYDLARYRNSLRLLRNMLPGLHGSAKKRPGTLFLADLGEDCWLIPFSFNTEASQNFVLLMSHKAFRVADVNGMSMPTPIATPYDISELPALSYAQVGDIVYLAHPNHPLHKIMRTGFPGVYQWAIQEVAFNASLPAPGTPTVTFNRLPESDDKSPHDYTLRYKVVAVDANGKQSLASPAGSVDNAKHVSDWLVGNYATISWPAVDGATEYNIYREEAGYFGFIGVSSADTQKPVNPVLTGVKIGDYVFQKLDKKLGIQHHYGGGGNSSDFITICDGSVNASLAVCHTFNAFYNDIVKKIFILSKSGSIFDNGIWVSIDNVSYPYTGTYLSKNSYAYPGFGNDPECPNGREGTLWAVPQYSYSYSQYFKDVNYEADTSDTPREDWEPFKNGNNPGVVSFHQQRMILAGTPKSPQTFYMSRVADFENFRKSRPLKSDDPAEIAIASGSIDAIKWAVSFGDLLIGTSGSEYKASGGDGAISATNISVTAQSYWGSAGIPPLIIGNSVLHVQRHGAHVRDLFYSLERDGYAGNDLSIMASHLVENRKLRQWAYQQSPGSIIWIVRDDGIVIALTYMKEQEIWGWSRHVTDGSVLSIASVSGNNGDEIFFVVRRGDRYFLERLAPEWGDDAPIADAFFVDCGVTARWDEAVSEVGGLGHLEGKSVAVLADGSPVEGLVVAGGKIVLPYPARVVQVGLPYSSVMAPLPVDMDTQAGSTLGKKRGYGRCKARVYRTVGGRYGTDLQTQYDFPYVPAAWGEPVEPFSGDIEFTPPGGQEAETTVYLEQDRPLPFCVLALMLNIDFGEN